MTDTYSHCIPKDSYTHTHLRLSSLNLLPLSIYVLEIVIACIEISKTAVYLICILFQYSSWRRFLNLATMEWIPCVIDQHPSVRIHQHDYL